MTSTQRSALHFFLIFSSRRPKTAAADGGRAPSCDEQPAAAARSAQAGAQQDLPACLP